MTDEELRARLDKMATAQTYMSKSLAKVEERVEWFFERQHGEDQSPVEQFVETTREWRQAKFVARLSRYVLAAAAATSAVAMGWWKDLLDFARATGGK